MKTKSIGFIGGGRITRIFLHAFENAEINLDTCVVFDTSPDAITRLKTLFTEVQYPISINDASQCQIIILAVHPPVVPDVLKKIKDQITKDSIVLSLTPKITIAKIEALLPHCKVARMIPNATSLINDGYNPISFASNWETKEKKQLLKLLKKLGKTFETEEAKLESYAIVSAMLPTYFWFQWLELENIAVKMGLDQYEAKAAVRETLRKATKLFSNRGCRPTKQWI